MKDAVLLHCVSDCYNRFLSIAVKSFTQLKVNVTETFSTAENFMTTATIIKLFSLMLLERHFWYENVHETFLIMQETRWVEKSFT